MLDNHYDIKDSSLANQGRERIDWAFAFSNGFEPLTKQ